MAPLSLAIHSTSDLVGVHLARDGVTLAQRHLDGGRTAIRLPEAIASMLEEAGAAPRELGRIAVALGPGSFTGIKVGLAIAYGLARSTGAAVVGVDSLEILAQQAPPEQPVAALLPAGRGELYVAVYGAAAPGTPRPVLHPARLVTPAEAGGLVAGMALAALGCEHALEGFGDCPRLLVEPGQLARSLESLAGMRPPLPEGRLPDPVYLRRTWAEESLAAREALRLAS